MSHSWSRIKLWIVVTVVVLVSAGTLIAVPASRYSLLRTLGNALVHNDPLGPAEVIVISTDSDGAGVLEAADLFHQGIAPRVALFADPPDVIDREFVRRGVPYFNAARVELQQLKSLGITNAEIIPRTVTGTEDEGRILPDWCAERQLRRIVFVATRDHSKRTRRVLDRAMRGRQTTVMIRAARFSDFDPDAWWKTRGGVRTEIQELEKLLLDILRHPLS